MNGPARPMRDDEHRPSGSSGRTVPSGDVYDELDQFVDSEPVAWSERPAHVRRTLPDDPYAPDDEPRPDDFSGDFADDPADFAGDPRDDATAFSGSDTPDFAGAIRAAEPPRPAATPRAGDPFRDREPPRMSGAPREAGAPAEDVVPAFSHSGASTRREAFAQRLSAELDKPPEPKPAAPAKPAAKPAAPAKPAARPDITARPDAGRPQAPRPAAAARPDGARTPPAAPRATPAAPSPAAALQRAAEAMQSNAADRQSPPIRRGPAPTATAAPTAKPTPTAAAAATAPELHRRAPRQLAGRFASSQAPPAPKKPVEEEAPYDLDALARDLEVDDEAPADALEWELDNAISAIIQNNRKTGGAAAEPPAVPPQTGGDEAAAGEAGPTPEAATGAGAEPAPGIEVVRPGRDPLEKREAEEAPRHTAIGTRRTKPVPSFQFERRQEMDDEEVAAPDPDNPLSNIFFQDVREHFDAVHPRGAEFDDDPGVALPDMGPDGLEDEYAFDPEDDERLPPSLSRAARRRGSARMRTVGAVVAAVAALFVVGLIGVNIFGGSGDAAGNPPVIQADARDVKVRAVDAGIDAEPDILERTQLGETEELVLPDRVEIGRTTTSPITLDPEPEEDALVSHRVRTVVVRPDGTIVPSGSSRTPPAEPAAQAAPPAVSTPGEPAAPAPVEAAPYQVASADAARRAQADTDVRSDVTAFAPASEPASPLPVEEPAAPDIAEEPPAATTVPSTVRPPRRPTPPVRTARTDPAPAAPVELGNTRSAAAPAATTTQSAPVRAAWGVQVSSQRTRSDAERSFANLRARYPSIIGSTQPMIVPADVADRGLFYRVRLPASSRAEANALCQKLKAAGADCFIGRN